MDDSTEQSDRTRDNPAKRVYRWVFGVGHDRNLGGAERMLRYAGGGVCLLAGLALLLARPGFGTLGLTAILLLAGGYMVYEARVQYCPVNHAAGRSTYED